MKHYFLILLVLVSQACESAGIKGGEGAGDKDWLVSAEAKGSYTAEELKKSYTALAANVKNGYTAYRITYNTTDEDGKAIVASGAIFVPDAKGPLPLLNYNHGTLFPAQEKSAPSYLGNAFELNIGKLFSASGYLVVLPDYVGYGSTKEQPHPYGAYHVIARTVVDMLRAVKEFCTENTITLSGKNFFSGWSEGAAVALATVKTLEEQHPGEFTPTAAVLNAGPYYTSRFAEYVLETEEPLRYMRSYVWILQSYNRVFDLHRPLTYYFKKPAATLLEEGKETELPADPQDVFTTKFIRDYKNGKDTALLSVIKANDLWNWKPKAKITFCHGDKDEYVPLFNSEKAYNTMKEKGADVTLEIFKGATHGSGIFSFLQQAFGTLEKER